MEMNVVHGGVAVIIFTRSGVVVGGDNGVCGARWSQSTNGLLSCGDRVAIVTLQ